MTAVVFEGSLQSSSSLDVAVAPAPLRVTILATNSTGAAPLTTTFTAVITGGTGTFREVLWRFGDGGSGVGPTISYSYVRAGDFPVAVNVTDSSGASASGRHWVNVSAGPSPEEFLGLPAGTLAAIAVAAAVGGALAGAVGARWWNRRRPDPGLNWESDVPAGVLAPPAAATPVPVPEPEPRPPSAPPVPLPPAPPPAPRPGPTVEAGPVSPPAAPSGVDAPRGSETEMRPQIPPTALRLSQRIVLHLQAQGTLGPDEVAPVAFSQLGMSEALSVRQNALTNVLRRLVAAEVLSEDVRHVQGQPRRLKVYRLTARGESVARDVRQHGGAHP